jgi:hypothetical protein
MVIAVSLLGNPVMQIHKRSLCDAMAVNKGTLAWSGLALEMALE